MKINKSIVCTLIFLLSFTSIVGLLTPTEATDTWTDITLPYTISEGGNYRIAQAYNGSGTLLSINASNVVVDGQDNLIKSTQEEDFYAIAIMPNCTNVVLENINQTGSDYGVYAEDAGKITVKDSTFSNNTSSALFAINATQLIVQHSRLSDNFNGLVIINSNSSLMTECHVKNDTSGLIIVNSNDFTLANSYINNNSQAFETLNCNNVTVTNSTFDNNYEGLYAINTGNLNLQKCNITNSNSTGFLCAFGNFTIKDSSISNNRYGAEVYLCNNITIDNSVFNNNSRNGFSSEDSDNLTIRNSDVSNNNRTGIACYVGNLTLTNCTVNNNEDGIDAILCNSIVISNATISNNHDLGLIMELCNSTIQDSTLHFNGEFAIGAVFCNTTRIIRCDIQNNYWNGMMIENCNRTTISNSIVNNNEVGILAVDYEYSSSEVVIENTQIQNNSYYGIGNEWLKSLVITNCSFSYNGFGFMYDYYTPLDGALLSIDSNCTITGNTFFNNSYAFMWADFDEDIVSTQVYSNNNFQNNTYTMVIAHEANSTNGQFSFYNNLVNDTAYINPITFLGFYYDETTAYAPSSTVFHLNATMQAGVRVYGMGSMIGGNYWAHPNGTGPSETGIDANKDGFLDTPVELFDNATYGTAYDYLAYSNTNSVSVIFTNGTSQQLTTGQASDVITVKIQDLYGAVISGATLNLASSSSTGTFYSDAACSNQINKVTIPVNASTASFYYKDLTHGTPTIIVSGQNITTATTIFRVLNPQSSSSTPTPTTSPTTTPTPTPTPNTIQASKDDNTKTTIPINGNITTAQFSNITITTNQTALTTTLSFTVTGETGTSGFSNLTIPKSQIPYGTTIVIYIDNQPAPNQGYTQDSQNYYVWFTTSFSTHQISLQFSAQPLHAVDSYWWITPAAVIIVIALVAVVLAIAVKRRTSR